MPLLSVLMPARNGEKYLAAALSSTLSAMPLDSELVLYDNGSTDSTVQIAEGFADRRLRIVRGPGGATAAGGTNYLLHHTDSEYVSRTDSDDYSMPWRFTHPLRELAAGKCRMHFGAAYQFSGRRITGFPTGVPLAGEAFAVALLIFNPVCMSAMTTQRRVFDEVGDFTEGMIEDWDMWLRAAHIGIPIRRSSVVVTGYRHHPSQMSAAQEWRDITSKDAKLSATYVEHARSVLDPLLIDVDLDATAAVDVFARRAETLSRAIVAKLADLPLAQRFLLRGAFERYMSTT